MNQTMRTQENTGTRAPWQFAVQPEPPAPFTRTGQNELERLKNRLLHAALDGVSSPLLAAPIRRAANEAAALAWLEAHPLLVFPSLFEEKVKAARRRAHRQQLIQARSSDLISAAA